MHENYFFYRKKHTFFHCVGAMCVCVSVIFFRQKLRTIYLHTYHVSKVDHNSEKCSKAEKVDYTFSGLRLVGSGFFISLKFVNK
jgi:hypothetical protein